MKILHLVGARPNFMKAAPVHAALAGRSGISQLLVHSGQHYDANMSQVFFVQLGMPEPDINLEVGSASHAVQTAEVMRAFEPVIEEHAPDLVLVYGDVNSTLAGTLVCAKLGVPVGHVESGLRSFDRGMPEEINRLVTDQLAELLFIHSPEARDNLLREGVDKGRIHFVGNTMIDTLARLLGAAEERAPALLAELGLAAADGVRPYVACTLHRPSNVDDPAALAALLGALNDIARSRPVVFPVHPRTRQRIGALAPAVEIDAAVHLLEPLPYLDFLALQRSAAVVVTDSGGVQEESTWLGIPCLTLRANTERPVTLTRGTNTLIGTDPRSLPEAVGQAAARGRATGDVPELWDGSAAGRIVEVIERWRAAGGGTPGGAGDAA